MTKTTICPRCGAAEKLPTHSWCGECRRLYYRERYRMKFKSIEERQEYHHELYRQKLAKQGKVPRRNFASEPEEIKKPEPELSRADKLFYSLFASAVRENRHINKKTRQETLRRALELERHRKDC